MGKIAVIDTETNWFNELMSIGVVIADEISYEIIDKKYYVIDPSYLKDGMYSSVLFIDEVKTDGIVKRNIMVDEIKAWFNSHNIKEIFAYNANFDFNVLHEFQDYIWRDIMAIAAYKQHNEMIPDCAECFKTGRLKKNYGVEPMYRLLSGNTRYKEVHNALCDAIDELKIMEMLQTENSKYKQILKRM